MDMMAARSAVVWKYPITNEGETMHYLPVGAEVLHVHEQNGQVNLWCRVDPDAQRLEPRVFLSVGTGREFPPDAKYLGTAHLYGGRYVMHVFEAPKPFREGTRDESA